MPALPPPTPVLSPDIRLLYTPDDVALFNVSGHVLDLRGLVFESGSGSLAVERWDTEFLTRSLSGFTNGDCLQVWSAGAGRFPKPARCRYRHAWIAVGASNQFWKNTETFWVSRYGTVLGTCHMAAGTCDVSLSAGRAVQRDPVSSTAAPADSPDLLLLYNPQSFALVNVSGRSLDLRDLAFASDSGRMAAARWDQAFLTASLARFPAGDCLQVWGLSTADLQPKPGSCDVRHAWVPIHDSARFWVGTGTFGVQRGGERLATCSVNAGACEVRLP